MTISAGSHLGPYEIVAPLGAGGMGEVWRARDTRLEREVAIKVLPVELAADRHFRARFEREAKTISKLEHPNICRLYDVGEIENEAGSEPTSYLVMELLDGEPLADRLERGPLRLQEVLRYGREIARALDRAHRVGVIHRDLKPGNIMLTNTGAKLLDFGLARSGAEGRAPVDGSTNLATEANPLTQEGTILGTFQYMAPEQLEGEEADARTDIFALGCVLYEMATGKRAFTGKSKMSLIAAIVDRDPQPISEIQPLTPPAFEHIVAKCLAKDPDDRWQSARDVAGELAWIGQAGSQAGAAASVISKSRSRERLWIVVATVAALVGAAALGDIGYNRLEAHQPAPLVHMTIPSVTSQYAHAGLATISPDGQTFAFVATPRKGGKPEIWVRGIGESTAHPLAGTDGAQEGLSWSDDSRSILYPANGATHLVDLTGGPPVDLSKSFSFGGAMNRSGEILLGGTGGIRRIESRSGASRTIITPDKSLHEMALTAPEFLPGGRRFLFTAIERNPQKQGKEIFLEAGSLVSKAVKSLGPVSSLAEYVEPGYLLYVRDGALMAVRFDPKKLATEGDPVTVAQGIAYRKDLGSAAFWASQNGILTYRPPVSATSIVWLDAHGRPVGKAVGPPGRYGWLRITPDGDSVVVAALDPKAGTTNIWRYGLERPTATRLTFGAGFDGGPVLSSDGKRLFYYSDRRGVPDIYRKALSSDQKGQPVLTGPELFVPRDVSPDGRYLCYGEDELQGNNGDIWMLPLDKKGAKPFPFVESRFDEVQPVFSPDGKAVAYTSNVSGRYQVYVKPFPGPGEAKQISLDGGTSPHFGPSGGKIYFLHDNGFYVADLTEPDREPALLFHSDEDLGHYAVAPDGKKFLFEVTDPIASQPPTQVVVNWPVLLEKKAG